MKKNLALLLAVVLVLSSLVGLTMVPAGAETTATTPSQEIALFNVSIETNVSLLFAVPAEGYTTDSDVSVLVWQNAPANGVYSKATAEAQLKPQGKITQGGQSYIVFTYAGLSAAQMAETVYARVCYNGNYGNVYDYSIAEFANSYLSKNLKHDELVEAMMDYGAFAAIYNNKINGTSYKAYDADDTKGLQKITVTAKIGNRSIEQVTQLALAGETVTLAAPIIDGASVAKWDVDDADPATDGVQVEMPADGLEITAEYAVNKYVANLNADVKDQSFNSLVQTNHTLTTTNSLYNIGVNLSGVTKSNVTTNFYHEISTIDNPYTTGDKAFRWTFSTLSALSVATYGNEYSTIGFGETSSVINFEMELGGYNQKQMANTPYMFYRLRVYPTAGNQTYKSDGNANTSFDIRLRLFSIYNGNLCLGYQGTSIAKIPQDRLQKFVVSADFKNLTVTGYTEIDGVLVKVASISMLDSNVLILDNAFKSDKTAYSASEIAEKFGLYSMTNFENVILKAGVSNLSDNVSRTEGTFWLYGSKNFTGTAEQKKATVLLKDENGEEVETNIWTGESWNIPALQKYVQDNGSMLIDNYKVSIGKYFE